MAATAATAVPVVTAVPVAQEAQQLGTAMPLKPLLEAQVERAALVGSAARGAAAAMAARPVLLVM